MAKRLSFKFHRPQQAAAVLLLLLLAQCLWVVENRAQTAQAAQAMSGALDVTSPAAQRTAAPTTLAYRVEILPLAAAQVFATHLLRAPAEVLDRHLGLRLLLSSSGFIFLGLCLGAALWWVTRRLYGNFGGFIALALYCFSPSVIRASTRPNDEILIAFGLFAVVYTVMGVAHALQGPKNKWRPRIFLFTLASGFLLASDIPAFLVSLLISVALLSYLAVGRRSAILPVLSVAVPGALFLAFALCAFQPEAFIHSFASGRLWITAGGARVWFDQWPNAAVTLAMVAALVFYCASRRSRYFGNTLPLIIGLGLFFLSTPDTGGGATLWALPFLFAFIAGIFADVFESDGRRMFSWAAASVLALEIAMTVLSLPGAFPWTAEHSGGHVSGVDISSTIHLN